MNVYLILGNGFSIDLMHHIKKQDDIALSNLFKNGEKVKWSADEKSGFLSYKYTPALWRLGARPTSSGEETIKIIENILTSTNVFSSLELKKRPTSINNYNGIYLKAYNELLAYLRSLFIHYDDEVNITLKKVEAWVWTAFLLSLNNNADVDKVIIITYNYDVLLERVLRKNKIGFSTYLGDGCTEKFEIYKPHGSISFIHDITSPIDAFTIRDDFEHEDAEISEFKIRYNKLTCNPKSLPLIPPAGQSSRYPNSWATKIRTRIVERVKESTNDDIVIISGLSYWSVDREEIDEILVNFNLDADVSIVNPNPPEDFLSVITTLFKNVTHYPDSKSIGGLL